MTNSCPRRTSRPRRMRRTKRKLLARGQVCPESCPSEHLGPVRQRKDALCKAVRRLARPIRGERRLPSALPSPGPASTPESHAATEMARIPRGSDLRRDGSKVSSRARARTRPPEAPHGACAVHAVVQRVVLFLLARRRPGARADLRPARREEAVARDGARRGPIPAPSNRSAIFSPDPSPGSRRWLAHRLASARRRHARRCSSMARSSMTVSRLREGAVRRQSCT